MKEKNNNIWKNVDYNNFAKTFSNSRKNLKWEEIEYFLSFIESINNILKDWKKVLDIGAWNWRLLSHLKETKVVFSEYLWIDLSEWLLEEANFLHPEARFLHLNMQDLDKIKENFNIIFFIASFHHLTEIKDRLDVLKKTYDLLEKWWIVVMTNWSLNSEINTKKYNSSVIKNTKNRFWSIDYNIKIWEFDRYYHCFDLKELEYLFLESWFKIIENREFENKKNFVSILRKN
jgi:SAM-dependent methyltransferase